MFEASGLLLAKDRDRRRPLLSPPVSLLYKVPFRHRGFEPLGVAFGLSLVSARKFRWEGESSRESLDWQIAKIFHRSAVTSHRLCNRVAARAPAPGGLVRPPLDPAGAPQHQAAGGYEPDFCAGGTGCGL